MTLGIDLGTTRTSVAMVAPSDPNGSWYGGIEVLKLADGPMTPSAVLIDRERVVVGNAAKNMGHRAADCAQVFKREMPNERYRFSPQSRPGTTFSAKELSTLLLNHVVSQARSQAGVEFRQAVITVPAYFGDVARRSTRAAGENAGLDVLDIINEPTAAILAYLFQPGAEILEEPVLVFDLGGGTLDTVVVDVKPDELRLVAIDGDMFQGGRDFDEAIAFELAQQFMQLHDGAGSPLAEPNNGARIRLDVEREREALSFVDVSNIPVWGWGEDARLAYNCEITREDFEAFIEPQIDHCLRIARRSLASARESGVEVARVLFVGGATRTPVLRRRVLEELGLREVVSGADPDLLVAKGAAVWAFRCALMNYFWEQYGDKGDGSLESSRRKSAIADAALLTNFDARLVDRLLGLTLESVTSRGYAIECYNPESRRRYLVYLIDAQDPLPIETKPGQFVWNDDIDRWILRIYEDSPERRGSVKPKDAVLVETIRGETHREWPAGSAFRVVFRLGTDQILHVHAWHEEGDAPGGELRVQVSLRPH